MTIPMMMSTMLFMATVIMMVTRFTREARVPEANTAEPHSSQTLMFSQPHTVSNRKRYYFKMVA